MRTKKQKTRTPEKKINMMTRIKGIEEGNREAMRQTERKRYQREKDKINAKRRERQKQKKEEQLLINQ